MTKDYSQHGEQRVLAKMDCFKNAYGLFVDIGASDGVTNSNTRWLLERGWRGIYVEPSPYGFDKLIASTKGYDAKVYPVAVAEHDGMTTLFDRPDGSWGLSTVVPHLRKDKTNQLMVPCLTIGTLVQWMGLARRIGMVSIDAEGMDERILMDWPFDKLLPSVMVYEHDKLDNESAVNARLVEHGYVQRHRTKGNAIYEHANGYRGFAKVGHNAAA